MIRQPTTALLATFAYHLPTLLTTMRPLQTLYLCGPMTGLPNFNYPVFKTAAAQLRAAGYVVICPTENGLPCTAPWPAHMRVNIKRLMGCCAVATLPGTSASKGATLELTNARSLAMTIHTVDAWLASAATGPSLRGGRVQHAPPAVVEAA